MNVFTTWLSLLTNSKLTTVMGDLEMAPLSRVQSWPMDKEEDECRCCVKYKIYLFFTFQLNVTNSLLVWIFISLGQTTQDEHLIALYKMLHNET